MVNLQKKSGKMNGPKGKRTLLVAKKKRKKDVDSKQKTNEILGKKVAKVNNDLYFTFRSYAHVCTLVWSAHSVRRLPYGQREYFKI